MRLFSIAVLTGGLTLICGVTAVTAQDSDFRPVTDDTIQNPDPGDWLMWRRTLNTWGHSPLEIINRENVGDLSLVWVAPLSEGIQEGTPLVYNGTMYFPNPSDHVQAFDAATGDLLWEYRRELPDDLGEYFPVPAINRNLAIFENLIIDTSSDDFIFALDAQSGELVWETKIAEYQQGSQQTSGPIIANGKVISGRGCEPEGGPEACVITAHDPRTGEELWRTRTMPAPGEPGDESWGGIPFENRWQVGTWLVPSFDPDLNMIYVGTSVTSPAPKFALAGNNFDYLYNNSTLALDVDTGEIVWYYQHVVDHWDLDHTFERMLVDTAVSPTPDQVEWINPRIKPGEVRKVITGIPGKTGIIYTLDRETGEFLWATPTVEQNVVAGIDGATGAVTVNPESLFHEVGDKRLICPNTTGGKNWQAGSYNPDLNIMYFPLNNTCAEMVAITDKQTTESLYGFRGDAQITPGTDNVGTVWAIAVETGETVWKHEQRAGMMSLLSTAGGLIFGGDTHGRFRAFDQDNGEVVWEVNLGSAITGYPVTFSVDGRQYVAASTGTSLTSGGLNQLTPELRTGGGNNLFVFALPVR